MRSEVRTKARARTSFIAAEILFLVLRELSESDPTSLGQGWYGSPPKKASKRRSELVSFTINSFIRFLPLPYLI